MSPEQMLEFIRATARIYRCPNTGRLLESAIGDDKVCCPCGKPNPKAPREVVAGLVHHHVYLLEQVSPEQYVAEKKAKKKVC